MKSFLFLSLLALWVPSQSILAQKKIYYDKDWEKCKEKNASYYRLVGEKDASGNIKVEDYFMDGTLQMSGAYTSTDFKVKEGPFKYYSKTGALIRECTYMKDSLDGPLTRWNKNGKLLEKSNYRMSLLEG